MISPTTQALERAIRAYVAAGSGLESKFVRPGNAAGPAPNELYATVLFVSDDDEGVPYERATGNADGGLDVSTVATVQARYSVQWYRIGARDAARRFRAWASSPEGRAHAKRSNLRFVHASEVRRLDAIVSDAWEERAGVDLEIGYLEAVTEHVDAIAASRIVVTPDGAAAEEVRIPA